LGAKVDANSAVEDCFIIEVLFDGLGGGYVGESDNDAAKRFERGEGVDVGVLRNEIADGLEVRRREDFGMIEVCDEERV